MSAEPAFLIAAVRHFLDAEAPLPDSQNIDWTAVLWLANAHTVTPMLYNAFRETPIPDAVAEQLRSAFETSVRWSLAQSGELTGLVGLFEEKGIPVVALKGPLLSRYLYGDLSVRSSGDIDVLVKQDDVRRSRDALVSSGCRAANRLHWNSDSACLRLRGQEMAFDSPSGVSIDVHWRLVPPHFPSAFDELDGWESLATVTLAGRQVHTLAPEPLLLFLCSHGAKHMFERLGWICDIARVSHGHAGIGLAGRRRSSPARTRAPASIVRLAAGRRPCRCRLTSASAEGYGGGTSGPRRLEPPARRRHTTGFGTRVAPLLPPPYGASRSPATLCRRRIPHTFRSGVQSSATPTPAVLPLLPVPPHSPVLETCDPAADRRNLRLVGRWLEGAVIIEL